MKKMYAKHAKTYFLFYYCFIFLISMFAIDDAFYIKGHIMVVDNLVVFIINGIIFIASIISLKVFTDNKYPKQTMIVPISQLIYYLLIMIIAIFAPILDLLNIYSSINYSALFILILLVLFEVFKIGLSIYLLRKKPFER